MKTIRMGPGPRLMGNGPYTTAEDRKRGIWTAIAILAVYVVLAVFYAIGMGG